MGLFRRRSSRRPRPLGAAASFKAGPRRGRHPFGLWPRRRRAERTRDQPLGIGLHVHPHQYGRSSMRIRQAVTGFYHGPARLRHRRRRAGHAVYRDLQPRALRNCRPTVSGFISPPEAGYPVPLRLGPALRARTAGAHHLATGDTPPGY